MTPPPDRPPLLRSEVRPRDERTLAIVFFSAFAALILYGAWRILAPYATSILIALVLVTFTYPMYERLTHRLRGHRAAAATLMLLLIVFTLIVPALFLGTMLVEQATELVKVFRGQGIDSIVQKLSLSERLAFVHRFVPSFDPRRIQPERYVLQVVQQIPGWVAEHGPMVFSGLATSVLQFFLMLLATFFFYLDGEVLARNLVYLSPLPNEYDYALWNDFRGVIQATFRGHVLTAVAQGALVGIAFWIAGVPAPVLWGAVAVVFAFIPMAGAAAIWIPGAIYLFLGQGAHGGGTGWGIFMLLWGLIVVSLIDNVIRPWAMRGGLDLPAVVVLFAILGGLEAFGFAGLVLGPLIMAMLLTVVRIYQYFFADALEKETSAEDEGATTLPITS